jgi:poly-gamma-glutamate synthesis protein (capsule biosynthesis protein)
MKPVTLFLCGDVMTGRGIDQILEHPSPPEIHEPYVTSALEYVELAESKNGRIPRRAPPAYIWGQALAELERVQPHVRVVNLETSVTRSGDWVSKGINYRMHPGNVGCLTAAHVDCCALANNHVLDWAANGLNETLATLAGAGIKTAGAGMNRTQAESAAVLPLASTGRVLVYSLGVESSGIPEEWSASNAKPGVYLLDERSEPQLRRLAQHIRASKRPDDIVVASIHWGSNWGYTIFPDETRLAHWFIDEANVDVVHGHSSHHPRGIEVYRGKLVLYGCGDFINDYEGIHGYESFHPHLALMYFPTLDPQSGRLLRLELVPMRRVRFRCERASEDEASWLCSVLQREGRRLGTQVTLRPDQRMELVTP